MLKVILTVGCPASGKSTWAKAEIAKDPINWVRINNDDLRSMTNGTVFSAEYEKLITDTRNFLIKEALKRNKNVIIDNVNANKRHWQDVCKLAEEANRDIQVFEKPFYAPLDELIARDSQREGKAKVGEVVIKKFFKDLGKDQFKFQNTRTEIFKKKDRIADNNFVAAKQNEKLERAYLVDLDGTVADLSHRSSPYAANECLYDSPIKPVIETIISLYKTGSKIIFMSGRSNQFKDLSEQWINEYIQIDGTPIKYELFMRSAGDQRGDQIIKKELFEKHVKNNYYTIAVFDDRPKVIRMWRSIGLTVFQLNDVEF
jgi:predicted kinase